VLLRAIAFVLCLAGSGAAAEPGAGAIRVRDVRFVGLDAPSHVDRILAVNTAGAFQAGAICACLLAARQKAEADGRLDFSATIEVTHVDRAQPLVDITVRVWMGSPYRVGRIEFTGHRSVNESTLRRALDLPEGERFDVRALRRGLARLNASGLFEPISLADIEIVTRSDGIGADLRIALRERPRNSWRLSSAGLPWVPGSLQLTVSSRLPGWGRGILEASTYVLTWNLFGLASRVLGLHWLSASLPLVLLERPLLPGQAALSGLALSPGLSARSMLAHYAGTHVAHGIRVRLAHAAADGLVVPVVDTSGSGVGSRDPEAGTRVLMCDPVRPRLWWLRQGAVHAAQAALAWLPFP
jgi:hypothetical protein